MSLNPQKEYYYAVNNANRDLESYNLYRDGVFLANTGLATSYADSMLSLILSIVILLLRYTLKVNQASLMQIVLQH